jgi:hypothetical protein
MEGGSVDFVLHTMKEGDLGLISSAEYSCPAVWVPEFVSVGFHSTLFAWTPACIPPDITLSAAVTKMRLVAIGSVVWNLTQIEPEYKGSGRK